MDLSQIESFVNEHVDLLVVDSKSLNEAAERAGRFLVAQAVLASYLKSLDEDRSKVSSLVEIKYAVAIKTVSGKNITEKKIFVAEDHDYVSAREGLENLESLKDWVKTHMKIFENAHIMFRQYSKE